MEPQEVSSCRKQKHRLHRNTTALASSFQVAFAATGSLQRLTSTTTALMPTTLHAMTQYRMRKTIRVLWTSKPTSHYLFLHPGVLRLGEPHHRINRFQLHFYLRLRQKRRLNPCLHRRHCKKPPRAPTATPYSPVLPAPLLAVKFVIHYRANGNNRAALAGLFQKDTVQQVHKLGSPKLGSHANLDIAHQLDRTFRIGNAYATTNTPESFSAGEQEKKIPNTFKEGMGLPQMARCKAASNREVVSLEKHGVYELIPIT